MRDQHVLCTGGAGGLGNKVTIALVRRGARVTVPVVHRREADSLVAELGALSTHVLLVECDLLDDAAVGAMVTGMPRLDALVHLVGGFAMGPTIDVSLEQYHAQIDLNLTTTFIAVRHALRRMQTGGYGRIVTVSPRAALEPTGGVAVYAAAKAAVLAFTRAVADEARGTNVTANCVLPSIIDTPANREAMGTADVAKWVKPERLAETIAFLASEEAGDLRGSAITVYGSA